MIIVFWNAVNQSGVFIFNYSGFNKFLIDLSIQFTEEEIAQDAMFIPVQKETNSYLKTLVSKE